MRQKNTINFTEPIPIKYFGTPLTDEVFENQGWEKVQGQDFPYDDEDDDVDLFGIHFTPDPDLFDEGNPFEDFEQEFDDLPFETDPKYPNEGDWDDEYYFWVLKLPRDWPNDDCLTLISTTSDHHLPGFKKGEYIVELYNENGLGICQSEEQLEILYKALTGESIYE